MKRKVTATGIRAKYREALDPVHFDFPRKTMMNHRIQWYLDGSARVHPAFGVYSMACFAEYLFHHVKFGKRGQSSAIHVVAEFFAATRRALQNTLSTYPLGKRLSPAAVESLRGTVDELVEIAREAYGEIGRSSSRTACPACRGRRLTSTDAELLEAILLEQSRNGTIPSGSALYRTAVRKGAAHV